MNSAASAIVIFSVWIAGIAVALYMLLPDITSTISYIDSYANVANDTELRSQIDIDQETSYTSFTPLGILDFLK